MGTTTAGERPSTNVIPNPKMKLSITRQAPLLDRDSFGGKLTVDFI